MKFFAALLLLLSMRSEANVCAQDSKKFCAGIEPGKGQLAKCLEDYKAQLSPACAKELQEFKAKTGSKNPCFEDLAEFCADVPTDPRKLEYCLLKNENRLSARCSTDFKKKKSNLLVRDVCAQDIANTCYSAVTGAEGGIHLCLMQNKAKLSSFCKKAVEMKTAEMKKRNPCLEESQKHCPDKVKFADIHACMVKKLAVLSPTCKKVVEREIKLEEANPCIKDLRLHCKPGLSPTEQHRCLTVNEKELSNACRQFRVQEAEKLKKMVDVCEPDRLKLCPKAPFENGMVLKCLRDNIQKVSPQCKELMK